MSANAKEKKTKYKKIERNKRRQKTVKSLQDPVVRGERIYTERKDCKHERNRSIKGQLKKLKDCLGFERPTKPMKYRPHHSQQLIHFKGKLIMLRRA